MKVQIILCLDIPNPQGFPVENLATFIDEEVKRGFDEMQEGAVIDYAEVVDVRVFEETPQILTLELRSWIAKHALPQLSADELLLAYRDPGTVDEAHRLEAGDVRYLEEFITRWDAAQERERLTFIAHAESVHTGGNCMVDLLTLRDGRALGVTDECVVLYPSRKAFDENDSESLPMLSLEPAPAEPSIIRQFAEPLRRTRIQRDGGFIAYKHERYAGIAPMRPGGIPASWKWRPYEIDSGKPAGWVEF